MEKFESQEYRDELAREIKQEPDRQKRREILKKAKTTPEYQKAKELRRERVLDEKFSKIALESLGLDKSYEILEGKDKNSILKTPERIRAFDNIDAFTNPHDLRIEQKKGIASEVLKGGFISEKLLRNYPIVYLGSGIDIEYPLVLGGRKIIMVDPILESPDVVEEVLKRIETLTQKKPLVEGKKITFEFNFGLGSEVVIIEIENKPYNPSAEDTTEEPRWFSPPEEIGIILGFISQGPEGSIFLNEDIKSKVVKDGVILGDDILSKRNAETQNWEDFELGHKYDE